MFRTMLRRILAWLSALLPVVVVVAPGTALGTPSVWPVNGHAYEAVPALGISWAAAEAACEARGGYLATITSAEESAYVLGLVYQAGLWRIPAATPCYAGGTRWFGPWLGSVPTGDPYNGGTKWNTGESMSYWTGFSPCWDGYPFYDHLRYDLFQTYAGHATVYFAPAFNGDTEIPGYVFESCTSTTDTDGDSLCDCWESPSLPIPSMNGVFMGTDSGQPGPGDVDKVSRRYALPGSRLDRKDLFVEVDALDNCAPAPGALSSVISAFGSHGITLHADLDETAGAPQNWTLWTDFDLHRDSKGPGSKGYFGTASERNLDNWPDVRRAKLLAYRYCVFAYTHDGGSSSGDSNRPTDGAPGNGFVVTLGAWGATTAEEQAGTFMHELGHSLGLRHGGGDGRNLKPNYFSVMNYLWQTRVRANSGCGGGPPSSKLMKYRSSWELDYSNGGLHALDENHLSEPAGIGGSQQKMVPVGPPTYLPNGLADIVPMGGAVNWDRIGAPTDPDTPADANDVNGCSPSAQSSPGDQLRDWNDWDLLQLRVPSSTQAHPARADALDDGELTFTSFLSLSAMPLDCNGNGLPDEEDIASGRSTDSDGNGVPDDCDAAYVEAPARGGIRFGVALSGNPLRTGEALRIRIQLDRQARVSVRIHDVAGAVVRTLFAGDAEAGEHEVRWDGNAEGGARARPGVYFVSVLAGRDEISTRLVLLQ